MRRFEEESPRPYKLFFVVLFHSNVSAVEVLSPPITTVASAIVIFSTSSSLLPTLVHSSRDLSFLLFFLRCKKISLLSSCF